MKKAMIYGGVISLSLIALGTVFKIFHWPGAAISLLLGFFILCFVFFPSALYLNYNSVKKGFGTNLAAFTGGTILMIGVLFKVMHWPGTHMLLIAGFGILLGIFIPLLLFSRLRDSISSKEKRTYVIGALGIIPFGFATLFKIMHWPGAAILLILGSLILFMIFIPMYTNMQIKANKMNAGQFVFVITLSMYAVVLTSLLTMNVSKHVLESFSRDERDNALIVNYFENKKARLLNEIPNDSTAALLAENKKLISESANKTRELIHTIKLELVAAVQGVDKTSAEDLLLQPNHIAKLDNYNIPTALLFNGEPDPAALNKEDNKAYQLKVKIENYRSDAVKAAGNNEKLTGKIKALLNTDDNITNDVKMSWQECNFYHSPLISVLVRLSEMEKNICLIETEVLTLKN